MGLFSRKKRKPVVVIPLHQRGPFHAIWIKQNANLPSPGMDTYAYSSLYLVPQAQVGAAISVRGHTMEPIQGPQAVYGQTVTSVGIPTQAGSMYHDPLFDYNAPGNGYTDPFTGVNNVPYPHFDIAPAGEAF